MNNAEFLNAISNSYIEYLNSHPRSSKKLVPLHGKIAEDLQDRLGDEYVVHSLGFSDGKEKDVEGRYFDKRVDISVFRKEGNNQVAIGGVAVKSIMTNYSQNRNNYFENMLGETANLRSANKLYFQVIILPEELPYFGEKKINGISKKDIITKIEHIEPRHLEKYMKLSNDVVSEYLHSPNKTLLYLINTTGTDINALRFEKREKWKKYMKENLNISASTQNFNFGNSVIYNDYEKFMDKIAHAFLSV